MKRQSIRTQLYALVFAVALPFTLLLAYTLYNSVSEHNLAARDSVSRLAQITAADAQNFIDQSRIQVERIARRPLVRQMNAAHCDPFLTDYLDMAPNYTNISVMALNGIVVCAALRSPTPISVSETDWFREVVRTGKPVLSKPQIGIVSRKWIVAIAQPIFDADQNVIGVISLSIDLVRFPLVTKSTPMLPGGFIGIQDSSGVIVARWPDAEKWVGVNARGKGIIETVLREKAGQVRTTGIDGVEKLYGFTPIPGTDWTAVSGVPSSAVFSSIRDEIMRNIIMVLAISFLVAMLTHFIRRRIETPIYAIAEAARAVSEGRMDTRVSEAGPAEISDVARQFNAILDNRVLIDEALRIGQERFRMALQNSAIAVFTQDLELRYTWVYNSAIGSSETILGKTELDLFEDAQDAVAAQRIKRRVIETGNTAHEEITMRYKGQTRYYDLTIEPLRNSANEIIGISGVGIDITERVLHENALQLAANAFESTLDGIIIIDAERRIVSVNKAFSSITGYTEAQALGRTPEFLEAPDSPGTSYADIWKALNDQGYWHGEVWRQRANGEIYPELLRINAVKNKSFATTHYVKVFNDISLQVDTAARLDFMAHHDALTQLPNRIFFLKKAQHAITHASRFSKLVGIVFIDLDRFKSINDSLGHQIGDLVLQAAAKRLTEHVRHTDTVARFGGDEFAVLLDDINDIKEINIITEKLLQTLSQPFSCQGHELFTSASIGVSWYPRDGDDVNSLLKNADVAMYRAKEHGKNTYEMFSPEMNAEALENLAMTNSLHQALDRNEFVLHYQPRVNLANGHITGVEALVRWQHPKHGLLLPVRFIHLAEESGIIARIGEWVMKAACEQMSAWHGQGIPPLRMAVNLSARQFRQPDLVMRTQAILREARLDAHCLELEITETVVIHDPENTRIVLNQLKALGIKIAIDDFGIGQSSLAYLKRFPLDFVKIDKSFIQNIPENNDDVGIIRAIITLAKSLKLKLIAEGVENREQQMFLQTMGCEEAQGYFFQVPKNAEETGDFLREHLTRENDGKVVVSLRPEN